MNYVGRTKNSIIVLLVICLVFGNINITGLFAANGNYISHVSAAKYSSGTKDMTKSIKVKSYKGRKMKKKEAYAISTTSFRLLSKSMSGKDEDTNVLISPVSIMYAFGMAENGAKGKTKSQLEKTVNGGVKSAEFNKILAYTRKQMISSKSVKWNIANSIWYKKGKTIRVKKSFLRKVKAYYGAEIYRASFNSKTVNDINLWVKKNTDDMIPEIINQKDRSDVMYIINAMSFEGQWEEQFTDKQIIKDFEFTNKDGSVSKVNMLSGSENLYFKLNDAYGFRKNYSGGQYSFVGIEVPEGITPAEYVEKLSKNGKVFVTALNNMKRAKVTIKFPEFESDYDTEMSSLLCSMGAKYAFDRNKANLYNMFEKEKMSNYYFSKVLHKTHIEVDSKGTKAAAATAIIVSKVTSAVTPELEKIDITLDHPFVYAVVDNSNNIPVFVGVVNNMGN